MYTLIAGSGTVGSHIAEVLVRKGHNVSLIDTDSKKLERLNESLDVMTYHGEATDRRMLEKADAGDADLFVSATNLDEINLISCAFAKNMGAKKTLARVRDENYYYKRDELLKLFRLDRIFSPETLAASEILSLIKTPGAYMVESFARDRAQLRSIKVPEDSASVGKTLKEIRFPHDTIIAAIQRQDVFLIPSGQDAILPHDELYFVGKPSALDEAEKQLRGHKPPQDHKSVIIYGGSFVSLKLAMILEKRQYDIKIIESDPVVAESISGELERTSVICGAVTDIGLLKEERVDRCDVFVAASKESDKNIIAAILAGNLGAQSVIIHVEDMYYYDLARQLHIQNVINARMVAANSILRLIMREKIRSITVLDEEDAEMIEVEVAASASCAGRMVKELGLPKGTIIATLVRGEKVVIPRGEDQIEGGDIAIVFTHPNNIDTIVETLTKA